MKKTTVVCVHLLFCLFAKAQKPAFSDAYTQWCQDYARLQIPQTALDYRENFENTPSADSLLIQEKFFIAGINQVKRYKKNLRNQEDSILFRHMEFECRQNLERIRLQKRWQRSGKKIPVGGLYQMNDGRAWYAYYVKHFTGPDITPEKVMETGKIEVEAAKFKIDSVKKQLGFKNDEEFYRELTGRKFFLTEKREIESLFRKTDSTVRTNLHTCFNEYHLPLIEAMEWPGATSVTPPGIYLSRDNNAYQKDVFQFNFSQGSFNTRCADWLYLHEAIPGHHMQHYAVPDSSLFFYFGTTEGWACYIENLGKPLGLYQSAYSYVGMQEWNLVRSARLVMEVGIQYYGWSYEDAVRYWKQNIKGQDTICNREVRRITNWPGQALCYKMGANAIRDLILKKMHGGLDIRQAHHFILSHSQMPLYALCAECKSS